MKKVLLVCMPFSGLERQAIGISLLKAHLKKKEIACDIRYLNMILAELITVEEYQWICNDLPNTAFAGEWVFTHALYGPDREAEESYVKNILQDEWKLDDDSIRRISNIREMVPHFMDYCMEAIPWNDYAIVGFTSTFEQNIPSLGLARRIKEKYPKIKIVFGGGNWEDEMGIELHQRFPFIDYVCTGEADYSFPALVKKILANKTQAKSLSAIKGIVYRSKTSSIHTGTPGLVYELDKLPYPDYIDYFRDLDETSAGSDIVPTLLFETSRGCWWGNKCQCNFCGLNGNALHFRSKSTDRAISELDFLVKKWRIDMVQAVDNVINMNYLNDFFPRMAKYIPKLNFFYEVRANLNRKQIEIIREAGVSQVQPGIESLSNHVLKLMRKGTTALQNIQMLKWCREYGIGASWNLLYGFPHEKKDDYIKTIDILHHIRFLDPPTGWGPIRLDRFSPYFISPAESGLINIRPIASYKYLYPFPLTSLKRIAYYFDYDYEEKREFSGYINDIIQYLSKWKENPEKGTLKSIGKPNGSLFLVDTRSNAVKKEFTLSGIDKEVYEFCDSYRSCRVIKSHLNRLYPKARFTEKSIKKFLDALVSNRLMVKDGRYYLSLALRSCPINKNISEEKRNELK